MSEAGATPQAAAASQGHADQGLAAGFISKQTPLDARAGQTDRLPPGTLGGGEPRGGPVRPIQPEGEGPDVMMEPLREHDPEARLRAIADAQADTDIAAARAHVAAVKNHGHRA